MVSVSVVEVVYGDHDDPHSYNRKQLAWKLIINTQEHNGHADCRDNGNSQKHIRSECKQPLFTCAKHAVESQLRITLNFHDETFPSNRQGTVTQTYDTI